MREFDQRKWEKGLAYAEANRVKILDIQSGYLPNNMNDTAVLYVNAEVYGSNERVYEVLVAFNEKHIFHAECNCDKYRHAVYSWNNQYCKHIAAVIIVAFQQINYSDYDLFSEKSAQTLVQMYTKEAVLEMSQKNEQELVTLEPSLLIDDVNGWSVSFKIGAKKKYVIKNLSTFYTMMQQKKYFTYGKDYELLHSEEVFAKESIPLLQFILTRVEEANALSRQLRSGYDVMIKREIRLTKHNVDLFMEQMIGKTMAYTISTYYTKEKGNVVVAEKNPDISMTIIPEYYTDSIAGVTLIIENEQIFKGNKACYQIHENELYISDMEFSKQVQPLIEVMNQSNDGTLKLGKSLVGSFYNEVLPKLTPFINVSEEKAEEIRQLIPEKVTLDMYFDINTEQHIVGELVVKCAEQVLDFMDERQALKYSYATLQAQVLAILTNYIEDYDPVTKRFVLKNDEDTIYQFFYRGIELLTECGTVHGTDVFKNVSIKKKPAIVVGVQMKSDLLNLSIDTEDFNLKELSAILASYSKKKKYHRLKNGSFVNLEDETFIELADLIEGLQIPSKDILKGNMSIPAYRALYIDRVLQDSHGIAYERNQQFKKLVRDFKSVKDSDYEVPECLKGIMRSYQKTGYRWLRMLHAYQLNGILADDMGLGKTLQVIGLLLSRQGEGRTSLVIAPASLIYNWESEFNKFAPDMKVGIVAGTPQEREYMIEEYNTYDVLISSYDLTRRDIHLYENKNFYYQIIDEAQYIKNHTTLIAKSVKIINAKHKLAMTGTPIENRLSELWSIFDYLMPGFLYSYEKFRTDIEVPIVKSGEQHIAERLKKMVAPFILRRLKQDVLKDLPSKLEEVTYAKMDAEQQKLYTAYVAQVKQEIENQGEGDFQKNKLKIFSELTRLRQICCDPSLVYSDYSGESAKLETCLDLIESGTDGGHKILLFSQFTSMLKILAERLTRAGITYFEITGATPKAKRLHLVDTFNNDDTSVFLISLKAGGTGLNLTGADIVIHYDPWWNVAAQNQATDRAHRLGQKNIVTVFQLIAKDTIEEKILKMQEKKKHLADQIISGEENQLATMTKDDFIKLFE